MKDKIVYFQLVEAEGQDFHAGSKAPRDAVKIASSFGFVCVKVRRDFPKKRWLRPFFAIWWLVKVCVYELSITRGAVVFLQHPVGAFRDRLGTFFRNGLKRLRRIKIITLIHDVDELRGMPDMLLNGIIGVSDVLIVHNSNMQKWFESRGVPTSKLVSLRILQWGQTP